jgi:hypothetical protein
LVDDLPAEGRQLVEEGFFDVLVFRHGPPFLRPGGRGLCR